MDVQLSIEFMMALTRALEDPEVRDALDEIGDTARITQQFGNASDEHRAFRAITEFALREAQKLRAIRRDLSLQHFTQRERALLENHPTGRALLARMTDGDRDAIAPAASLLIEIRHVRTELGL